MVPIPPHGACPPPSPLAFPFTPAQGRSQSPSWLHPGQPARPHGPFRQELSRGPARPLPSSLLLSGPVESRSARAAARSSAPSEPRAAASRSTAHTARNGGQKRRASGAAEVRQRKRDKNRRRMRRHINVRCGVRLSLKHSCTV